MTCPDAARPNLATVLERFPDDAVLIKRLVSRERTFRSICDDYDLVRMTLAKFEKLPDAQNRPEVPDYQVLIAELEKEIADYLLNATKLLKP